MNTTRDQNQEQHQEPQPAQHPAVRGATQDNYGIVGRYLTRGGKVGVAIQEHNGRYRYIGLWGAGSGLTAEDMRASLATMLRGRRGVVAEIPFAPMVAEAGRFVVAGFGTVDRARAETLIYRHTHPDYKGTVDGVQTVMLLDPKNGGSRLFAMADLTDGQIMAELPYALKKERERTGR